MFDIVYNGETISVNVDRERTPYGSYIITVRLYRGDDLVGSGSHETGNTLHGERKLPANGRAALRRAIYQAAGQPGSVDRENRGQRFWGFYKRAVIKFNGNHF